MTNIHVAIIRFIQSGEITTMLADTYDALVEVLSEFLGDIVSCLIDDDTDVPDSLEEMLDFLWQREELEVDFVVEELYTSTK